MSGRRRHGLLAAQPPQSPVVARLLGLRRGAEVLGDEQTRPVVEVSRDVVRVGGCEVAGDHRLVAAACPRRPVGQFRDRKDGKRYEGDEQPRSARCDPDSAPRTDGENQRTSADGQAGQEDCRSDCFAQVDAWLGDGA